MKHSDITSLLAKYPPISDQLSSAQLEVILKRLESSAAAADPSANVVEFGCYMGTAALLVQRLLGLLGHKGELYIYDSFEGLPDKTDEDMSPAGFLFNTGELKASKKLVIDNFKRSGLKLPRIHKGWFDELDSSSVPQDICFALLDGDYYQSITTSLELIEHRMCSSATIIVDDYANEKLPGARLALDQWLASSPAGFRLKRVEQGMAIVMR